MSTFSCPAFKITDTVEHHPNADRLSLIKFGGYTCISAKLEDGSHRYNVGDVVVYIPTNSLIPENLLKEMDFWNEEQGKGTLSGSKGNRVREIRLRGIFSSGLLYKVEGAEIGKDYSEQLGITKYEPSIPSSFNGLWCSLPGQTYKYDLENIEREMDTFTLGERVYATVKIHGTRMIVGWCKAEEASDDYFGDTKRIWVTSKGLYDKGICFKNDPENDKNVYVRHLKSMLKDNFESRIKEFDESPVVINGELYGQGIQDLTYGTPVPKYRVFDIKIDGISVGRDAFLEYVEELYLDIVICVYEGPFDFKVLEPLRDGVDPIDNITIREGLVITSYYNPNKKVKWVSPDYLLRKSKNATEYT